MIKSDEDVEFEVKENATTRNLASLSAPLVRT
jgi:hypothetical protein